MSSMRPTRIKHLEVMTEKNEQQPAGSFAGMLLTHSGLSIKTKDRMAPEKMGQRCTFRALGL